METKNYFNVKTLAGLLMLQLGVAHTAQAQVGVLKDTVKSVNEVVVTGVTNPNAALSSSISISTLRPDQIDRAAPRTTAEIFRQIPGIRTESSAGDGNTNLSVRGVPLATGGSKYLLIQEDGLPVLQFGDIAFGTQDQFVRADATVGRVESVRGGSASTLASNSPAGIINFISKDGRREGGSISSSVGVDYRNLRSDIEYGTKVGDGLYMHVGGFYRQGVGPRDIGFNGNDGGQIKANLLKEFDNGYVKVYVKALRDHTAAYMPMPMTVSGSNAAPVWGSVDGYNALTGGLQTPFMSNVIALNEANQPEMVNVHNGMTSNYTAVGTEFKFDLGNDWTLTGRSRYAGVNGRFVAPFPASFGTTEAIASGLAGAGNTYTLQNQDDSTYEGQTLMVMHLFNTKLNNFNNLTNDYNINKKTSFGNLNFGLYQASQQLNMSWLWNSYLMSAADAENGYSQLIDINRVDSTGAATALTENGLLAYGVPAWGNCCQRNYNVAYNILAPYLNGDIEVTDALTLSVGARYDMGTANGTYAGSVQSPMNDINGNGTVSAVENSVSMIDNNNPNVVNYNWNYLSYSVGANYQLDKTSAVFGRYSKGGRAGADRVLFGDYLNVQGGLRDTNNVVDFTSQAEVGYKMRKNGILFNATAFFAQTDEKNFEATTQKFFDRTYNAVGLELEAGYTVKNFQVYGNLTYTKATIAADEVTPSNVGKTPRRQAPLIYTVTPVYNINKELQIGANLIGTASSFAQDNNELVMSGYFYLNPYISWSPIENLSVMLQSNNVLNQMGVTESEEGAITDGQTNYVRARSIAGRSTAISIRYRF